MTAEQYDALLAKQDGLCAICHKPPALGRYLAVDHDHTTDKVRGLLCHGCNRGIGMFNDDPAKLRAAIEYLGLFTLAEASAVL